MNRTFETVPPKAYMYKKGAIWELRTFNRSSGASGSYEHCMRQLRRYIAQREAFFKKMQARGKNFPSRG